MDYTEELLDSCRSVHWYAPPEEVLKTPALYLQHVMMFGLAEDEAIARKHYGQADLKRALDTAPAGFFSPTRWRHWQTELGGDPNIPLPRRFGFSKEWWLDGIHATGKTAARQR